MVESIREAKKALRKEVKENLKNLTEEYKACADEKICQYILGMREYKDAEAVFCFVGTKDEIDTTAILEGVLKDGKKLLVPKCLEAGQGGGNYGGEGHCHKVEMEAGKDGGNYCGESHCHKVELEAGHGGGNVGIHKMGEAGIMDAYEIKDLSQLSVGAFGILEPSECARKAEPSEIQFAVIPCLSCDKEGHRLGHGGGYYDRYLSMSGRCFPRTIICREKVMVDFVPTEKIDEDMDFVVTEAGVWYPGCRGQL